VAVRQEVNAELEAMRASVTRVQDLVLGSADRPRSLVVAMSMAWSCSKAGSTRGSNEARLGCCLVLVAAVLHFSELKTELEVLGSGCNTDLIEDKVDALWTHVCTTSDSLAMWGSSGGSWCR
jgi:hypothetical protein